MQKSEEVHHGPCSLSKTKLDRGCSCSWLMLVNIGVQLGEESAETIEIFQSNVNSKYIAITPEFEILRPLSH